jgi:hypothetical protein
MDELDLGSMQVHFGTGGQVVQDSHMADPTVPQQAAAQVGADETGASGDQDLHD